MSSPDSAAHQFSICRVCDDSNGQPHYGTICCPSCKGFFRRVYMSDKKFECYRGNMCVIQKGTRNICRACRYKKCLQVGMNVKDIRGKYTSPQSVEYERSSSAESTPKSSKDTEMGVAEAMEMAQVYMNLEKYCENNYCESNMCREEENRLIDRMLSSTVHELIQKTSPQCPRFKRDWKPLEMLNLENFCRSWSRSIVHFLDFATRFPVFNQLSHIDKRAWFISRLAPCSFLTMAYQTRIEMCEGLLFGCSNVFPLKSDRWIAVETEHLRGLFSSITETMFSFVIYPMMNLKITDLHYSLLKACVFFSAGIVVTSVSDKGMEIMRNEYTKHKNALMKLLMNGVERFSQQTDILFQIQDVQNTLERVSAHFDQEIQYFHFLGLPIVKKNLLVECHINKTC
ncbi:Nuclear Hormone Receptor family [Caenorhabditis elegans]|uniref:Nuclear Hormone Receptor family n=1 Tax=Caenorhabditis elegans TaxID=6239 RepID=Q18190_CAEEL|nr:Nuclear Hormone Receptor family [Caenorhabditis elegans]CCD65196.3 Nuclear Hormone Receptor family [Caenorhabditis elegans]|eukprot:NP_501348.4 Nuclear Hormone Receptor family [Caenorhabditis elegans]